MGWGGGSWGPMLPFWDQASTKHWYTKTDSERKGLWETTIQCIPELLSSCHKFCAFIVVSNGLRSTLLWSGFQNFPGGACPQTPLHRSGALYTHTETMCATWPHQKNLYVFPPPLMLLLAFLCRSNWWSREGKKKVMYICLDCNMFSSNLYTRKDMSELDLA